MPEQGTKAVQLESLLVDEGEQAIDSLLHETLKDLVGFTKSGQLVTKPEFLALSNRSRLLIALLGRHVMVRLKLPGATLEATPETLQSQCLIKLQSCREDLSRLKALRLLEKNETGYYVPTWAIKSATSTVSKSG